MNFRSIDFSRNLVKGRIAETLFEQMLRDAGGHTILAFGYENILPELARNQHGVNAAETMEILRRAPDFAIIEHDTHEVKLIEVKYSMYSSPKKVFKVAEVMYKYWKPSYLFLATPEGFFMDKATEILEKKGKISPLSEVKFPSGLQAAYIDLLNELIPVQAKKTTK